MIVTFSLAKLAATKHGKRELIDASFNRYNYGDTQNAPGWFRDDEDKFNRPMIPYSKDDKAVLKAALYHNGYLENQTDPMHFPARW